MSETASSVKSVQRMSRPEVSWKDISNPGCHVEIGTGDLCRIPKEALITGSSPLIRKESHGASRLVWLDDNPYITTFEARMLACENNIKPNF